MITKLTLTIDDKVIQKAKLYAKANGRSLSELVESFFDSLTTNSNTNMKENKEELTPSVRSLMGSFKAPQDFDYKKILQDEKQRKFE